MRLTRLLPVLLLSLAASVPAAHADSALSPADAAALHSFQLSEDFLQRYMAAGDEIAKDPCRLGMVDLLKMIWCGGFFLGLRLRRIRRATPG